MMVKIHIYLKEIYSTEKSPPSIFRRKWGQFTYLPYFRETLDHLTRVVIPDFPRHIIR